MVADMALRSLLNVAKPEPACPSVAEYGDHDWQLVRVEPDQAYERWLQWFMTMGRIGVYSATPAPKKGPDTAVFVCPGGASKKVEVE